MSDAIWLALISGAFLAVTTWLTLRAPRQMAELNNMAVAAALQIANDRADKIAASVKRDTEAVRVQVKEAAALLVESNAASAAQADRTNKELKRMGLHVNSLYTAVMQRELKAVERSLTSLRKEKNPTPEVLAEIEVTEIDRDRIVSELDERASAARFAAEKHEI